MDYDLLNMADDLLEDRQDLSQYSYDPSDMLDSIGDSQPTAAVFASSQQSSQASEKLDGFLAYADAGFDDEETDLFDFDDEMPTRTVVIVGADHAADPGVGLPNILPTVLGDAVADDDDPVEMHGTEIKSSIEPTTSTIVPLIFDFYGNNITFDMKSESASSGIKTPSADRYSSPDSTNTTKTIVFCDDDDDTNDSENQMSITDNELILLSTRDLNRRIRLMTPDEQRKLKSRRRTLKNRGYAQTCRTRRVGQRSELEADNERLSNDIEHLRSDNKLLRNECVRLRREGGELKSAQYADEIQSLRANNELLTAECSKLRQEGEKFRSERDLCKNRLTLLLTFFSTNGIAIEGEDKCSTEY